jgi:hypothetical protein
MDPGTAAIAVLSTVTGVAGYGAMKVNKDQDVVIEQKVQERIAQTEERLKHTQEALKTVEDMKAKQDAELAAIKRELELLQNAKASFEQKPTESVNNPFARFFQKKPVPPAADVPPVPPAADVPPVPPAADVPPVPPAADVPPVPPAADVPPVQRKSFFRIPKWIKKQLQREKLPDPIPAGVPEPPPAPPIDPTGSEMNECISFLQGQGIATTSRESAKPGLRKFVLRTHPDKGGDAELFTKGMNCMATIFPDGNSGGMRKKKLRTRRGGKQRKNVRRTRRC